MTVDLLGTVILAANLVPDFLGERLSWQKTAVDAIKGRETKAISFDAVIADTSPPRSPESGCRGDRICANLVASTRSLLIVHSTLSHFVHSTLRASKKITSATDK